MSLSRNATGREIQRDGPATEKLLSPRRVRVLFVAHVKTSADHSDRRTEILVRPESRLLIHKVRSNMHSVSHLDTISVLYLPLLSGSTV